VVSGLASFAFPKKEEKARRNAESALGGFWNVSIPTLALIHTFYWVFKRVRISIQIGHLATAPYHFILLSSLAISF